MPDKINALAALLESPDSPLDIEACFDGEREYMGALFGLAEPIQDNPKCSGYVYLVRAGATNFYKIGKTKDISGRRLGGLQTSCMYKLSVVFMIPCADAFQIEKGLHMLFKHRRVQGEWFNLTPKEVEWLSELGEVMS